MTSIGLVIIYTEVALLAWAAVVMSVAHRRPSVFHVVWWVGLAVVAAIPLAAVGSVLFPPLLRWLPIGCWP